ncbi:CaiB/BaiF CoA transferase family protein [Actinomadura rugatobispora]|uniref:CaiB/BaiF CoA transferase family protein n=1 Tax=Actinomadura rugatobispora TaxID=1994 RepID=A0ABW1A8S1_9ACTN|nr:CaiB/BaiF CoA-transferase family protein [Actinomadura rugatobispora]
MSPLEGTVVVDFSELLPGPFLTQNLADLGARVIKVERPGGDNARHLSPGLFAMVNRGKEHRTADLKDPADRAAISELITHADVLVEGFRPGVMAKLGFDPAETLAACPRLVYVSVSGFGQSGPHAQEPGHDVTYAAHAGIVALAGAPGGPPSWGPGVPVADLCAAMYGLSSVLAALHERERTGRGRHLDVSIRDCLAHWLNARLGPFHHAGATELHEQRAMALRRPGYGTFTCADGTAIAVGAIEDHFYARLVQTLGLTDWAGPEWASYAARHGAAEELNAAVAAALATRDSGAALAELSAAGVPVAPVLSPLEAVAATPGTLDDPVAGPVIPFPVAMP